MGEGSERKHQILMGFFNVGLFYKSWSSLISQGGQTTLAGGVKETHPVCEVLSSSSYIPVDFKGARIYGVLVKPGPLQFPPVDPRVSRP